MTASSDEDPGSVLRELGWDQGVIVAIPEAGPVAEKFPGFTHIVIASQVCDIVASAGVEPCVDLIPTSLKAVPETDLQHGKNPRRLCLETEDRRFVVLDIRERNTLTKGLLVTLGRPLEGAAIPLAGRKLAAKWLAKRYSRAAFPDAFNERLRPQVKALAKLAKHPDGSLITAVFVMLREDTELAAEKTYKVVLWFAHRFADVDAKLRVQLEQYAARFADLVNACDGIEVVEHELRAHADISLADLEEMKRFDLDFRSEAQEPNGETVLVEGE